MAILSFGDSLKNFEYKEKYEEESGELRESTEKQEVAVQRVQGDNVTTSPIRDYSPKKRSPRKLHLPIPIKNDSSDSSTPILPPSPSLKIRNKRKQINLEDIRDKRLVPLLRPGLKCVFVGFNPGTESALKGHYYAHRSNLFWKLLYESGCVSRPVTFLDDTLMPEEFDIGFTDLVARPTPGIKQLSVEEMVQGTPILEQKIFTHKPKIVCLVGKGIWESVYKYKRGKRLLSNFQWGLQIEKLGGCPVYVVPSTSGLAASISRETKLRVWKALASIINTPADGLPPAIRPCPDP